jgi:hypothetical protein
MIRLTVAVLVVVLVGCTDQAEVSLLQPKKDALAAGKVLVTNNQASGPGSFGAAIAQANSDANIGEIDFVPRIGTVDLHSTVVFSGSQALTISANGATLNGALLAVHRAHPSDIWRECALIDETRERALCER